MIKKTIFLLGALAASAQQDRYVVHLDEPTQAAGMKVHYFLTGSFGGAGGTEIFRGGDRVVLPTSHEGVPGKALKAVLYAPGCEMKIIETNFADAKLQETFHCRKVSDVFLEGKVQLANSAITRGLDVEIKYFAVWINRFFRIIDGAVWTVPVARVPIDEQGYFRATLPDFSADPLFATLAKDGSYWIVLRERRTGNRRGSLRPPPEWESGMNLRIAPSYPRGLEFTLIQ